MFVAILVLVTSLTIAGIAAWYSITGLAAIFASAVVPIMIMGAALETGKLVTASWLYRNWRNTPFLLKSYLTAAVIVLMFVTSMGIFGFLSKAHLDQTISASGNTDIQIKNYERQISIEERRITDSEKIMGQLDQAVQVLMDYDRIRGKEGAIAVRKSQATERQELSDQINESVEKINEISVVLLPLRKQKVELIADVGPLKYIAELIYGEEDAQAHFDEAVRWVIIIIIFVFDPLAVLMLLAANQSFVNRKGGPKPMIMEVTDDGVRMVDEDDIYEPERYAKSYEDYDPEPEPFYQETEDELTYEVPEYIDPEDVDEVMPEFSDPTATGHPLPPEDAPESAPAGDHRFIARVPYNERDGLIDPSPGR